MTVSVGRLRPCSLLDWKFTVLSHNMVRGAAGAALLNAELLQSHGYLPGMIRAWSAGMIVMKFGGTSVEDAAAIDRARSNRARPPAEQSSRRGQRHGKVTDQLLAMGRAAGSGDREKALELSRAIRERHSRPRAICSARDYLPNSTPNSKPIRCAR